MFKEIGRVNFFLSLTPRIVECVSEYTFLISQNNKQKTTKDRTEKKAKETKEEKRISPKN